MSDFGCRVIVNVASASSGTQITRNPKSDSSIQMIQFDKFTQKAQEAMQQAQSLAGKNQHQAIHPIHLLLALANEKEGVVRPILETCGVQPEAILKEAERALNDLPKVTGAQPGAYISPSLNDT